MYNEEFLQKILHEDGVEKAIIFCEIESKKCQGILDNSRIDNPIDAMELSYERDWWAERANRLKNDQPC